MIYYNTSILSELLARAEAEGNKELCDQVKRLSPVAWQHINLLGNFTFRSEENIVDIKEFINFMLEENEKDNIPTTFMVEGF